ncbi:MAG TPA: patatin-like phospholipase family protein [Longimicrobium sp.]|jgi:hypothetical protein|uniref:patatin-like phospholipase family protein n=1 Tax=Longimicrobium sp. TaxID=2029185 RepID=UPI002ED91CD3
MIKYRLRSLIVLVAAIGGVAIPARSQGHTVVDTFPVILSASGGISRGAYQAGVNWALVQVFRGSRDPDFRVRHNLRGAYRVALATGASAGNVNATFSAIEDCIADTGAAPDSSLFWQLWAHTGWNQLYDPVIPNPRTDSSVLSRRYVEDVIFDAVDRRMEAPGAKAGCDIPIGITLTKVGRDSVVIRPATQRGGGAITAATQRVATVFSLRERNGRLVFEYPDERMWRDSALGKVILGPAVAGTEQISRLWVKHAMQASGAFPIAFQPVHLEYWAADQLDARRQCADGGRSCFSGAVFIDGGLFDNNPLTLALDMYNQHPGRVPGWEQHTRVIYIDTEKVRGDAARTAVQRDEALPPADRGLATLLQVAGTAVPAARQYELQSLARTLARDSRKDWIEVTTRSRPMIGGYLGSFAAFLGKPFREYDFYAGIYDGLQYAATSMTACDAISKESEACRARVLRGLITDSTIPFGDLAPHVLRSAYAAEYHDSIRGAIPSPSDSVGRARLVLLKAMMSAADELVQNTRPRSWDNAVNCAARSWEETLLCTDGFEFLLDSFRRSAGPELRRWRNHPDCVPAAWRRPEKCPAEQTFVDFIHSPRAAVRWISARLIHQLWRVEDRLANDPSTRPLAREDLTEVIDFFFNAFATRRPAKAGLDLDPSSIQSVGQHTGRRVMSVLPYSFSVLDGGMELGWRPTLNTPSTSLALTMPLSLGYRPLNGRWEMTPGLGLLWRTPWNWISGLEISGQQINSWRQQGNETANARAVGATLYLFADRLRFGARSIVEPNERIQDGDRFGFYAGLNDVNGMLYWITHFSFLERGSRKVSPPSPRSGDVADGIPQN